MFINIIDSYRYVVAICDKELIGKKFEQGKFQLYVKENFYKGELKSKQEIIELIKKIKIEDATFNIVGEKSIQTAIEAGIISEEGIKTIEEIPYVLVLL